MIFFLHISNRTVLCAFVVFSCGHTIILHLSIPRLWHLSIPRQFLIWIIDIFVALCHLYSCNLYKSRLRPQQRVCSRNMLNEMTLTDHLSSKNFTVRWIIIEWDKDLYLHRHTFQRIYGIHHGLLDWYSAQYYLIAESALSGYLE